MLGGGTRFGWSYDVEGKLPYLVGKPISLPRRSVGSYSLPYLAMRCTHCVVCHVLPRLYGHGQALASLVVAGIRHTYRSVY